MVWVHVFEELSPHFVGWVHGVVEAFGGPPAAPGFMICLGVGVIFTKHGSPKDLAIRGLRILVIGYVLNVFRYVLPDLIGFALTGYDLFLSNTFYFFSIDILEFAGLAFLFMALARKLHFNWVVMLLIGVAASVTGYALAINKVSTGNRMANQFLGYLWGITPETYFPFFSWIIFPIFGHIFGQLLQHCNNKKRFYLCLSPICGILALAYFARMIISNSIFFLADNTYCFIAPSDAAYCIVLAITLFGLDYAMIRLFHNIQFNTLKRFSKHVNSIYCIHWVLIGIMTVVKLSAFKSSDLPFWAGTLITIILLFVSDRLAVLYSDRRNRPARP
jgi:uncharacterized membrane protein